MDIVQEFERERDCKKKKKLAYRVLKESEEVKKRAIPLLRDALNDECPWLRGAAAEVLGKLGIEDERIVALLEDRCPWVRHRAADALSYLCKNPEFARKAYKKLIERLNDRSPYVQNYAVHALRVCLDSLKNAKMKEAEEVEKALSLRL